MIYLFFFLTLVSSLPLIAEHSLLAESCPFNEDGKINHTVSYTLAELLDIGFKNNPSTKITWWHAQRAAAALGSASSSYYPSVGFNASITNGRQFKFINGPDTDYTMVNAELALNFLLLDSGERRASVDAAKQALMAASWESNREIQTVMIEILVNAYTLFYYEENLVAACSSRDEAAKVLDYSTELNQAGLTPISDVYTSKATLAHMELEVAEKQALRDIQQAKLATSLGLCTNTPIKLAPLGVLPEIHKSEVKQLMAIAQVQRDDLLATRARLQQSIAQERQVKASYLPKLSLSGKGGFEHFLHDKAKSGDYQVQLNLSIPIFTGFEATYQNQMARADVKISEQALCQLQLDIALQVFTYSRNLQAASLMLEQAKVNLKQAKLAYEGVLMQYSSGQEKIAELSNALRQLTAARLRYSEVIAQYLTAMANLAYATGTL